MKLVDILHPLCERVKVGVLPPCQFFLVVGIWFMKFFHQSDLLLHEAGVDKFALMTDISFRRPMQKSMTAVPRPPSKRCG